MVYARKEVEIAVRFKNQPGHAEKFFETLIDQDIGILAHATYPSQDWILVLLITDNLHRTRSVLGEQGFEYGIDSIVMVDVPGLSCFVAQADMQLRPEGIGILYSYVSDSLADRFVAVFKTTDDSRAVRILQNAITSLWPHQPPMTIERGYHAVAI